MEKYLQDLIARLLDKSYVHLPDGSHTSAGSISVLANAEADKLSDLAALEPLKTLLRKEKKMWTRLQIYQLLASLAMNNHRADILEWILQNLKKETSVFLISFTIGQFRWYEKSTDWTFDIAPFRAQLSAYMESKDFGMRTNTEDFLRKFDPEMPKKRYKMLLLLRGVKDAYKRKVLTYWESLDPIFNIPTDQKAGILKRLLGYKYQIQSESEKVITLFHTTEKEVFCEIHAQYILFYTTDFNESSLFEVRQTPCEFSDTKIFSVFDVQEEKWVTI